MKCFTTFSSLTRLDSYWKRNICSHRSSSETLSLMNAESFKIIQTFAKTETAVGIRLVNVQVLRNNVRFVLVDDLNHVLIGCKNGKLLLYDYVEQYEYYKHKAHFEGICMYKLYLNTEISSLQMLFLRAVHIYIYTII